MKKVGLGVWRGSRFIVLRAASNRKLSIAVVDVHETSGANAKLLCKPGLDHYDEVLPDDFSDTACEWG
jgi:hypothetical protein